MIRFENEQYLYGLFIILLFIVIYIFLHLNFKKRVARYGDFKLIEKLMPTRSPGMQHVKFSLLMAALTCFIIALANPQIGSSLEKGMRKGVDIMVCFDVSNSMLAEDIRPNRLEASKMALSRFIDKLQGDRLGLVVFAGKSFVQLPITSDYAAAKMFTNNISTNMINEQGTDISSAIDLAAYSMLPENENITDVTKINNLTSKVIVIVSDGEDHHPQATQMAGKVNKLGMIVHTIGIGSTRGEPIPVRGANGNVNYKKDREGNTVMTRLNEAALQDIARAGGGIYVHATNTNTGFEAILQEINKMYKSDIEEITFARYESRYQIPLLIGVIFLIIEAFLFAVKPKWIRWFMHKSNLPTHAALLFVFFSLLTVSVEAQTREELNAIRRGYINFNNAEKHREKAIDLLSSGNEVDRHNANSTMKEAWEEYQKAEINYRKAMETTKNHGNAHYNLGNALYRQEKYDHAAESFLQVAEDQNMDKKTRANSFHNLGNSLMKQEKYGESVQAYKNALKLDPSDMDTKYNLEYAKQKLIQQQQEQQQEQQNGDKDQKQDKEQKNEKGDNKQEQENSEQNSSQEQSREDSRKNEQQKESAAEKQQKETDKRQLDALQQNERQTQQKVQQKEMQSGSKVRQEKDW